MRAPILSLHPREQARWCDLYRCDEQSGSRLYEHRNGFVEGHTKRFHIHRLVYFEIYSTARDAIQREKNMKHWPRAWKTRLIVENNPTWRDLFDEIAVWAVRRFFTSSPGLTL